MAERRKTSGGKLSRSETVSVRLDPRLRLAAELAAGKERRSLSSFVEWCVEQQTQIINVSHERGIDGEPQPISAYDVAIEVWAPEDADSFVNLATQHPDLMVIEDMTLWSLIKDAPYLWNPTYSHAQRQFVWQTDSSFTLKKYELRDLWPVFKAAADGDAEARKQLDNKRKSHLLALELELSKHDDGIPF